MKKLKHSTRPPVAYSPIEILMASNVHPMPEKTRTHWLTRIHLALDAMEKDAAPTPEDWRILSDAVNLTKAMLENGMVTDESGTYESALEAMAVAGARYLEGKRMGFSGTGIQAMRALVSDMADLMAVVSHRDMLKVHNAAAKRVYEVLRGKTRPGDVVVAV